MSKIISIVPNDDHTLVIELDNHHKIIYDMKSRLQTVRFCVLSDIGKFKSAIVEHGNNIVWDGLCQITIDEIFSNIER